MSRTFFTADLHLGHANIIKYSKRPFVRADGSPDVDLMDNTIIHNWNAMVGKDDAVWCLGDIFMGVRVPDDYFDRLNGQIHLIQGNHDKKALSIKGRFASVQKVAEVTVREGDTTLNLFLSHYAHRVWNRSHHGVIHLYGHSHGSLPDDPNSLSFDAGVDCWNFFPFGVREIKERIAKKTWKPVDHHDGERVQSPMPIR